MISGSSTPQNRVVLVASFGSLHDAEAAARFLTDRGVPTRAIGLSTESRRRTLFRSAHEERAVVAVAESQVESATGLLRRIGVDRMLV